MEADLQIDLSELLAPSPDIFVRPTPQGLVIGEVTDLTAEDLLELENEPVGATTPALKSLRASHHALARLLASGVKAVDASRMLGICQSRISILKADSSFKNLLAHYEGTAELAFGTMAQKLAAVGTDTLEVLHERILEEPDKIATETLVKIAEMSADRTGHGKQSNLNIKSVSLSEGELERLKQARETNVIQISQTDRAAALRKISGQTASADSASAELEGAESSGSGV